MYLYISISIYICRYIARARVTEWMHLDKSVCCRASRHGFSQFTFPMPTRNLGSIVCV